jgi:hypothetical protein
MTMPMHDIATAASTFLHNVYSQPDIYRAACSLHETTIKAMQTADLSLNKLVLAFVCWRKHRKEVFTRHSSTINTTISCYLPNQLMKLQKADVYTRENQVEILIKSIFTNFTYFFR